MAKRVLVVDDHAPTRMLIRAILEADGQYDVVEAATGVECLKAHANKGPIDLILLDVVLPDMDGFEICRSLRSVDDKVPIVFVTAKGELKDHVAGRAAGGDSYIVKPITKGTLRALAALFTSVARSAAGGSGATSEQHPRRSPS
jgi:DNA-binding response OmpR family regulator